MRDIHLTKGFKAFLYIVAITIGIALAFSSTPDIETEAETSV